MSESVFDQSQQLATEFAGTRYLRMPSDWDVENRTLVYPWLSDTLLSLLQNHQDFPKPAIKQILQRTSEAVKELHDKDWIHIGTALCMLNLMLQDLAPIVAARFETRQHHGRLVS